MLIKSATRLFRPQITASIAARTFSRSAYIMAKEFKLKGLTSLALKNGQKQEAEVEGIENGKVIVCKVGDKVHALNANCTHYGAPLIKGVLTTDGRLTCPWHGACFNVGTGDVEDAPALDPLHKFDVFEKDGAVYIKGQEQHIKDGRRQLNIKCKPSTHDHVVVIGSGSGALGAIEGLRSGGYKGKLTVISREHTQPIDRTKLSKALITDASKVQWRSEAFYKEGGIDFIWANVTKVDFAAKKLTTEDGKSHSFTKLIMASGGSAKMLPIDGLKGDLGNVFVLRSLPDTQAIMKAAGDKGGKKIVVIGSSFIGMEAGNCLATQKHDVTIVGMESRPMEKVLGTRVGAIVQGIVEKNGAKFYLGAGVEKAVPSKSDSSKVGAVHLKDGTVLECDLVIEGTGIKPSTDYLSDCSEIKLEKDGSVRVDEANRVPGLTDVFAIGDIATYPYHGPGGNGTPVRIEHWDVAQNHGRNVAAQIINPSAKPKPFTPVFWSAVGAQLRYCGNTVDGYDDVVFSGTEKHDKDGNPPSWVAYYTKGETVLAVASMMKDPYMTQSAELMRRGKMPSKSELQKGVDVMEVNVPGEIKI